MVCADLVHSIKCLWLQVPNIKSLSWHEHPHRRDSSQGSSPSITSRLLPSFCLSVQFKLVKFNFLDGRMTSSQLDICLQRLHPDVQSVTFLIIRDLLSRVRLHLDLPNTTLDSLLRDQLFNQPLLTHTKQLRVATRLQLFLYHNACRRYVVSLCCDAVI
jgi:hypothetical protein